MPKLINVSNRLPVTVGDTIRKSSGGLVTAMEGLTDCLDLSWVGWPGAAAEDAAHEQRLRNTLNEEYGYDPVFISEAEIEGFYQGFSNQSLWPILHYMAAKMEYNLEWWECYQDVNRKFADRVLAMAEPDDLIWVHDYQLMLVPGMLREANPDLCIGFFLHTPFPSYELFRCHPNRNELLEGMLGADLIGFHTYGYLRHFRSTVLRCLGIDSEIDRIPYEGRQVKMGVHPIGIDAQKFSKELASPQCQEYIAKYRESYAGKRLILSVERLDYTKGIPHRLNAVEAFLAADDAPGNVVFVIIAVPSRSDVKEYQLLREQVEGQVGRINGQYASVENIPIHFIHGTVSFPKLCALYNLAEVCMVTPLIDGMNLVAKEYVACQKDNDGVLILSEFAGAANELFSAITVNPYAAHEITSSLREALAMPAAERGQRADAMRQRVNKYDSQYWASSFMEALTKHTAIEDLPVGENLNPDILGAAVSAAARIAVVLDYDGTLREFVRTPSEAGPTKPITELLDALQGQPNADVFIVSGRQEDDLQRWLGHYPFTLVGEHGYRCRPAGESEWSVLTEEADLTWRESVLEVFRYFEGQTPGSSIEQKRSAMVWHYRRSDPEFGQWKAHQMMGELYETMSNLPVEIHHGKKIVEVSSVVVTKGNAVRYFVGNGDYDLVICAGDDKTDESMFLCEVPELFSIKVGPGDTGARYRVASPASFRKILGEAFSQR
ncbi:MAG: trehalose 6-phosphate synthase/phosphatase [Rhodothermales bacterium]|jgi:trehalose 6-phosphate synthase/phosphatase